ncbi:MAG: molybdopterin-binding protein [Gammaproteobacteria bacterium]
MTAMLQPTVEIFSQGEEVVTGQTVDSNAAWLSQRLVQMGFRVTRHNAVGDKLDDLIDLLREIAARADCCICSGGLGPTCDDLTAEAVSRAFGLPLQFDAEAFRQIQRYYDNRGRVMPEINRKQALLPQNALRLDNAWGTAPGFALQAERCWFAFVPGVPFEMQQLFDECIRALLAERFVLQPSTLATIKTVGIGESDIQQRLANIVIPAGVQLGFRAGTQDVQTKLLFPYDFSDSERQRLVAEVAACIGDAVFAVDYGGSNPGDLAAAIDALLQTQTLATAETASGGALAAKCSAYPWLLEASYADSAASLYRKLGLNCRCANLPESAALLAQSLRASSGADLALVQLYDGDHEALHDKDKNLTLYHALAVAGGVRHGSVTVGGALKRKRNQAALLTLDFFRRCLQPVDR